MEPIEYPFGLGDIWSVSKDAIIFAKSKQTRGIHPQKVYFVFNGIEVTCYASSETRDIVEKYMLQSELRRIKD